MKLTTVAVVLALAAPAQAQQVRNVLLDINEVVGAHARRCRVMRKRPPFHTLKYLHCVVRNHSNQDDLGDSHPHVYEYVPSFPTTMRRLGRALRRHDADLEVLLARPATHRPRRNVLIDVESILGDGILHSSVLVKRRGEPGYFLHMLVEDALGLPSDLGDTDPAIHEFTGAAPPRLRRAGGGPLHVYLGIPLRDAEPIP